MFIINCNFSKAAKFAIIYKHEPATKDAKFAIIYKKKSVYSLSNLSLNQLQATVLQAAFIYIFYVSTSGQCSTWKIY